MNTVEAPKNTGGSRKLRITDLILRFAALITCVVTIAVLTSDRQTKAVGIPGFAGLTITKTAKFNMSKAFVYLVSAAGIGAGYSILAIVLSLTSSGRSTTGKPLAWFIFVSDQVVTYVLLAAASASAEVAYMGAHPTPGATLIKVCSVFERFCNQLGAALVASFVSTVVLALSSVISANYLFSSRHTANFAYNYPAKA